MTIGSHMLAGCAITRLRPAATSVRAACGLCQPMAVLVLRFDDNCGRLLHQNDALNHARLWRRLHDDPLDNLDRRRDRLSNDCDRHNRCRDLWRGATSQRQDDQTKTHHKPPNVGRISTYQLMFCNAGGNFPFSFDKGEISP
jgi:hypothetical protein